MTQLLGELLQAYVDGRVRGVEQQGSGWMVETIDTGAHVALVDAAAGAGVLVAPNPENDMRLPGLPVELSDGLVGKTSGSLLEGSWNDMLSRLAREGWGYLEDDWDMPMPCANTAGGKTAYGLVWLEESEPFDLERLARETAEWEQHVRALLRSTGDEWTMSEDFGGDLD